MAVKMLQLSLCIVIFIHLTSSQSTYDVSENEDDVTSCSGTDEVLRQLTTAVKQLQRTVSQLHRDVTDVKADVASVKADVTEAKGDVAEVKADVAAAWKPQRTVAECPAEFQYIASVNGCYKLMTHNSEWSVATLGCRAFHKDAHLLVINNAQEHYAVAGMLASVNQTTLSSCYKHSSWGTCFWTAGQRVDPSRNSTFIWRVTSSNPYSESQSPMTYTNWDAGEPNWVGVQPCMFVCTGFSYKWSDVWCNAAVCSVCELDMP